MSICNYSYPTFQQFQCAAFTLLNSYRTGVWNRSEVLASANIIIGFASSQFAANSDVEKATLQDDFVPDNMDVIKALEDASLSTDEKLVAEINWKVLLPFVLELIKQWIKNRK